MGIGQSKQVDQELKPKGDIVYSSPARRDYIMNHAPLQKAALKGDWKKAESIFRDDPDLYKAQITHGGETSLHLAALQGHHFFVSKLIQNMEKHDTEILNKKWSTALCFAAAAVHVDIAVEMVNNNDRLPTITYPGGVRPLYMAVLQGHREMAEFLFPLSNDFAGWNLEDQITLLTTSIESGLYDLAMSILGQNRTLAVATNSNGQTALEVLARTPSAFCVNNRRGLWDAIIGFMKWRTDEKPVAMCTDAYALFDCLWDGMMGQEDVETGQIISENTSKLPFIAAESGNDGFLVKLIDRYPDFLYKMNQSKHSIFHIAVKYRFVKIFNLLYELDGIKGLITTYTDEDCENILHLAARIAPRNQLNRIPGHPLQMQREVLWYKEVEKIVQPYYRNMKNSNNQTPYDLFLAEHGVLMKEAEKSLKQIAKSCMLVTLLITTLVFSTAFTVPGGYNNNTGAPILENKKLFMVFPASQAVATLSSLISMLMFLSILASRYEETDFLSSLPFWLVTGVAALLISIAAMMVEFCTCLLFFQHGLVVITVILILFASVPVMFVILNYSLLVTILHSTCGSRWLFQSENRLFS